MSRPVTSDAILEVTFVADGNGGTLLNVWHYKFDSPFQATVDGDSVVTLVQQILQPAGANNVLERWRITLSEGVIVQHIRYQWITPLRYTPVTDEVGHGPGADPTPALPMNVCGVVTLRTLFAGKHGIGRKHFGGLTSAACDQAMMSDTFKTDIAVLMGPMMQRIVLTTIQPGLGLLPCVYNRANPTASHQLNGYVIQGTARVMRRRTLYVGK